MSLSHFKGGLKSVPRQLFRCNHMGKYFKKKFKNIQCKVMGGKKMKVLQGETLGGPLS
jgi:hypothetical protein